jgi:hypothetical protein
MHGCHRAAEDGLCYPRSWTPVALPGDQHIDALRESKHVATPTLLSPAKHRVQTTINRCMPAR